MLCENPICAIYRNGKKEFLSKEKSKYINPTDNEILITDFYDEKNCIKKYALQRYPCRKCLMCRWERSNEWALRSKLEAARFESNQFITLTYGQQMTNGVILARADLKRFMHNLREHYRKKRGFQGIRFFGCGEYGKKNLRPHYHLILFNCPPFGDEKFYKKDTAGFPLYKSEILERLWGKGFCSIGAVSDKSIDYVARMPVKSYYIRLPENYTPAFFTMSKQIGIGKQYLFDHFDEIVNSNGIVYDGKKYPIPHSFNRTIEEKIGKAEYRDRLVKPRQERARIVFENKAYQSGVTPDEAILLHRKQVKSYIRKLIRHDEETQI